MADIAFNIAKGASVEKFRDGGSNGIVILLEAAEADAVLKDYDTVAAILAEAGNTEATASGYARKTGLTGAITVDDTNDRVEVDIPAQTWDGLSGTAIVAALIAYEESASDAGRIPLVKYDFSTDADGSDVTLSFT